MLQQLDFSKHSATNLKVGLKEMFLDEVTDRSRWILKHVVEESVAEESQAYVELKRYERTEKRKDYPAFGRGYRTRDLITTWGVIRNIRVPRSRSGGIQPRTFERYKRVHPRVDEGVLKMFLMGVSTPKVADVLHSLFDYTLSASYVSKVAKWLDGEVNRFFDRPVADEFLYLFSDGIVVKVKDIARSWKRTLLVAYGIRPDGSRQLIDFRVSKHEGKGAWTSFLHNLQVRGLRGSTLKLIITDGGAGLWAATEEVFPFVPHQLCWVHKLRNVANRCPQVYHRDCIAHARRIYLSPTTPTAWHAGVPGVGENLEAQSSQRRPVLAQGHRQAAAFPSTTGSSAPPMSLNDSSGSCEGDSKSWEPSRTLPDANASPTLSSLTTTLGGPAPAIASRRLP